MADESQLEVLKQEVAAWNEWRREELFREVDLSEANLRGTNLGRANLYKADLSRASLFRANLSRARLSQARLRGANLTIANLSEARLDGADLSECNFEQASFLETDLSNVDLSRCKGLELIRHGGPSPIDTRTLQRSGPLPLVFLRGVGLPDKLIEYLPSLLNQSIQLYSCFISYSAKDEDFVRRLHADLQDKGGAGSRRRT
jgi:hypothetical protein